MTICRFRSNLFLNCSRVKIYLNDFPKISVAIKGNRYNTKLCAYGWILHHWLSSRLIIGVAWKCNPADSAWWAASAAFCTLSPLPWVQHWSRSNVNASSQCLEQHVMKCSWCTVHLGKMVFEVFDACTRLMIAWQQSGWSISNEHQTIKGLKWH